MEIIGASRDGVDQFFVKCTRHDYYYNGRPPLTTGCADCWQTYYFCQIAQSEGDKKSNVDQLESAIHHVAEHVAKGTWDFKPHLEINISKEN